MDYQVTTLKELNDLTLSYNDTYYYDDFLREHFTFPNDDMWHKCNLQTMSLAKKMEMYFKMRESVINDDTLMDIKQSPSKIQENMDNIDLSNTIEYLRELTKTSIQRFENFESTYLCLSNVDYIPDEIKYLVNIRKFLILMCNVSVVPDGIRHLVKLEVFKVVSSNLMELPSWIGTFENLTEMDLFGNNLTCLPRELSNCTKLTYLNLGDNKLDKFPSVICSLVNLQKLELHYNSITEIPPEIKNLTELKELFLHNNKLRTLPAELATLSDLIIITICDNNFENKYIVDLAGIDGFVSHENLINIKQLLNSVTKERDETRQLSNNITKGRICLYNI